jgi:hypothetical protein
MAKRAIQIPAGMECGICGKEFWTRAVGHWFTCERCRLTAERYIREDEATEPRYGARHPNGIGLTRQEYREAREECIRKGYLNKAGALTVTGRNAAANLKNFPGKE